MKNKYKHDYYNVNKMKRRNVYGKSSGFIDWYNIYNQKPLQLYPNNIS
jgi:hypothetical protein